MAQRLRWLATLPEFPGSFPSTTWWLTTTYNSCSRGSGTLMYRECRHTCRQSIHMLQSLLSLIHTLHSSPVYLEGSGQLQFNPTAALECLDKMKAQRFVQKLCLHSTSNLLFLTKCSEAHDDSMVLLLSICCGLERNRYGFLLFPCSCVFSTSSYFAFLKTGHESGLYLLVTSANRTPLFDLKIRTSAFGCATCRRSARLYSPPCVVISPFEKHDRETEPLQVMQTAPLGVFLIIASLIITRC